MTLKYDPTEFDTWRPNYEMRSCIVWFIGAAGYAVYSLVTSMPAVPILWMSALCLAFAVLNFIPARRRFLLEVKLAGTPMPCFTFDELRAKLSDPAHQKDMWIGLGFQWGNTQTQRVTELLKRDWHKVYREALGTIYFLRFMKKKGWASLKNPFALYHDFKEQEKRIAFKGQPWIHGVGGTEDDIYQPISHSEGHTLIIGTTGSGKTRCFDLFISQAIFRGETIFIIDPKGDDDLKEKAKRACAMLGREHAFMCFHPAKPDESIKLDLLANWTRATEVASRIANLIPSQGASDPFKNFAWGALSDVCHGLQLCYKKPTLKNLRHYLELSGGPTEMICQSMEAYFRDVFKNHEQILSECKDAAGGGYNREKYANALIKKYKENDSLKNSEVDGLIGLKEHDQEHFGKMITSVLPPLKMLTSGRLGEMLSPPDDNQALMTEVFHNTGELIAKNCVVYVGLDSLSDGMVGSAIGSLLLSDLTAVGGARYNFEEGVREHPVSIFVDEAAEVVNDPFIQLLNKGRGAGLKLFVATQTISDFAARMGSKDKAIQMLGNLNNLFSLRCIDTDTQKYVAERFPKTKIKSIVRTQGLATTGDQPMPRGGSLSERLGEEEADLFPPELLGMLPDLEYIACLSGGQVYKGRYPLLVVDKSEYRPG